MEKIKKIIMILTIALTVSTPTIAMTGNGSLKSSAKMLKTCSISGNDVDFGEINFSNVSIISKWSHILMKRMDITLKCNKGVSYKLINRQLGVPADNGIKCIASGMCLSGQKIENRDVITFGVYRNSNLNDDWVGDGASHGGYLSSVYNGSATGKIDSVPHYFAMYSRSWPTPDVYTFQYAMEIEY